MNFNIKPFLYIFLGMFAMALITKQCESEPKVKTKTKTVVKTVHDTITKVKIQKEPVKVYVTKTDTVTKITSQQIDTTSLQAKQYNTELNSNKATAKLKITTSGELYDVSGVITYPEVKTTVETIKIRDKSGLYMYGKVPFIQNFQDVEAGLMYQFKNSVMVMSGIQYDNYNKTTNITIGIGFKIL